MGIFSSDEYFWIDDYGVTPFESAFEPIEIRFDKETYAKIAKSANLANQSIYQYIYQSVIARMESESERRS